NGACCESGRVDACGACNGDGSAVDITGNCCVSGLRDDMGVCCPSARLDACGRCDGDGTSCALLATVSMRVPFSHSVASHALELASSTGNSSFTESFSLHTSTDGDTGNTSAGDSAGSTSNHHFSTFASAFTSGMAEILDVLPQAVSFLSITPAPCLPDLPGASVPNQLSSATEPNSQAGQQRSGTEQSDHAWESEGGCGQLDDTDSPRGVSVQFVALPLAVGSMTPRMAETSFREALVQYAQDSMQPPTKPFLGIPGASFMSLLSSTRLGICGNNICETGERCSQSSKDSAFPGSFYPPNETSESSAAESSCCPEDCPFVSLACPAPDDGHGRNTACSGFGRCLDFTGTCDCIW
ncbi:unnamed protein product, partial [Closterium sp. NIES-53]